jgi:hypothetical protein
MMLARRWQKVVNYGSPMTAWTMEMNELYTKHNGDKKAAQLELTTRQASSIIDSH